MALGRKRDLVQQEMWVTTDSVAKAPGHVFYNRLNRLLEEASFDEFVESLCAPFYADGGRPGIPPGVYFRMLFIGYFEGIDSQRGIAWRCEDSLSLRQFLGIRLTESTPDHSSLTRVRDRLGLEVAEEVFAFVLKMACDRNLISGAQVGVDATTLEANAAMKSIVRRDTGEDWKSYLKRLMVEEGVIQKGDEPSDEEIQRFDRSRKNKKVSNKDWESPTDSDARIIKMKDGRTHLGHKAEHTVDLESEFVLSATVREGTEPDSKTLAISVAEAQVNLIRSSSEATIREVAADKGYHANAQIVECQDLGIRTYIPEKASPGGRKWTDKSEKIKRAALNNRRRTKRDKSKKLQRLRSERVERGFAHICETGGARRTWLRGLEKINSRYSIVVAAHNLGLVMRSIFGSGKPREAAGNGRSWAILGSAWGLILAFRLTQIAQVTFEPARRATSLLRPIFRPPLEEVGFSTAC